MAIPPPRTAKSLLRSELRALLRVLTADSLHVQTALLDWILNHPQVRTIAAYSALPGEIDLTPVLCRHPEIRWAFPRVEGDRLTLHHVIDPAAGLLPGTFGILEPSPTSPEIPISEIDVFLCPGLAFDPRGGRVGRGRGFYDRLLAAARPDAIKLGICHPAQIVPDTFPESHDIGMDEIVSG